MTRRSTRLPADFVVRHEIPEGQRVSIQGLAPLMVRLFGAEAKRRAGIDVWDEEEFKRRLASRAAGAAGAAGD